MNAILYGFPAFSGWGLLLSSFLLGGILSFPLWFIVGRYYQKTREPLAWNTARYFEKRCIELSKEKIILEYKLGRVKGALSIIEEAVDSVPPKKPRGRKKTNDDL